MYKITAAATLLLALAGAGCASDRLAYSPSAYPELQPDYGADEGVYQEAEVGPTTVVASAMVQAATAVAPALMAHSRAASGSAGGIPVTANMEPAPGRAWLSRAYGRLP